MAKRRIRVASNKNNEKTGSSGRKFLQIGILSRVRRKGKSDQDLYRFFSHIAKIARSRSPGRERAFRQGRWGGVCIEAQRNPIL